MYKQQTCFTPKTVTLHVDDTPIEVPEGISVAAAVLGHTDEQYCALALKSGQRRGPHCLIGVCHNCSMEINGRFCQQACLVPVADNMLVRRQTFVQE